MFLWNFLDFLIDNPGRNIIVKSKKHTLSISRKTQIIAAHKKAMKS